jgi:hypothetical protein
MNFPYTNAMGTAQLITTTTASDQVIVSYTVDSSALLTLIYIHIDGFLTTQPGNQNPINLGVVSFELPSGTKVISQTLFHPNHMGIMVPLIGFSHVASGVTVRVVVTPAITTSITWRANIGGFES